MEYKREDLTINSSKYASIIGIDKSDLKKLLDGSNVPAKKGEYSLNEAIAAVEPFIKREKIIRKAHAFFTMKGGVGKTLTSYNMAHYLALLGYKTLLIDLDPQVNLSTICGMGLSELDHSPNILDVLSDSKKMDDCIVHIIRNVDLIPGTFKIGECDIFLANKAASDFILDKRMRDSKIKERYDFIFFDNHSSHSKASNNAFIVADSIVAVVNPDRFSFNGIEPVISTIEDLCTMPGKSMIFNILVNNYEPSVASHREGLKLIMDTYGEYVMDNYVKKSSDFTKATMGGKPFFSFSGNNSNAIKDYSGLLEEFIEISSENSAMAENTKMEESYVSI